jgi:hypothetical protein
MKIFKSLLLVSTCLLSSVSAADDMAAIDDDCDFATTASSHTHAELYAMGFEVETSGIKVFHDNEDEILIILESVDGKWQLTTDTQDKRIDPKNWVNLECRTVGGLTQDEIKKYATVTQKVMRRIKEICDSETNGIFTFSDKSFLSNLEIANIICWGSNNTIMRKLDKVTFATKRQVSDSSNEKIKLMTAYEECLEIFVFHRPGNVIGIEVKLADNKQLDKANAYNWQSHPKID